MIKSYRQIFKISQVFVFLLVICFKTFESSLSDPATLCFLHYDRTSSCSLKSILSTLCPLSIVFLLSSTSTCDEFVIPKFSFPGMTVTINVSIPCFCLVWFHHLYLFDTVAFKYLTFITLSEHSLASLSLYYDFVLHSGDGK
jgi:hypothetical protein